jgi:hypothetical protein
MFVFDYRKAQQFIGWAQNKKIIDWTRNVKSSLHPPAGIKIYRSANPQPSGLNRSSTDQQQTRSAGRDPSSAKKDSTATARNQHPRTTNL